jgi:glycosyltransferase involved in cell wall biosynthesis
MATGVPVICSIIGGTPDMIDDGVDGLLVAQEDEAGLAAAMRRLYDDTAFQNELGRAARQRAERQFDATRRAEALLAEIEGAKKRLQRPTA